MENIRSRRHRSHGVLDVQICSGNMVKLIETTSNTAENLTSALAKHAACAFARFSVLQISPA